MPTNSLLDLLGPRDIGGNATGFGDMLAQRSNSLIGLGLGLMSGTAQDPYGNAMRGYAQGASSDQDRYQSAQRLAEQRAARAQSLAEHRADRAQAQKNWEQQFARGGQTDFQKIQGDIEKYGEPARQFYASKAGDTSQLTKITNPNTGEEETVLYNPRAPAGQQFRPVPTDIFNPPSTTATPAATPGFAPAPLPVLPSSAPGAVPSTRTAFDERFGDWGARPEPGAAASAPIDPNAPVTAAPASPRGPADLPPRVGPKAFENEEKLRKEFNAATKPHQEVRQSYNRLLAAQDNAAGDIALIFGYMRMLDPGSVVREGEFATAQNAAGIPDMVRNMYNRALSGERLNPNQRSQFKDQAGAIYEKYDQEYTARSEQFRQIAKQNRIDPSRVIPDLGPAPKAAGPDVAVAGIDPRAIRALKNNPDLRDDFDAKYGQGAAMRILTGK